MKAIGLALVALVLSGCAMLRDGNPATTPNPKDYPCGYVDANRCTDDPSTCCRYHGDCLADGGCQFNSPSDPADPVMMRRGQRFDRVHE